MCDFAYVYVSNAPRINSLHNLFCKTELCAPEPIVAKHAEKWEENWELIAATSGHCACGLINNFHGITSKNSSEEFYQRLKNEGKSDEYIANLRKFTEEEMKKAMANQPTPDQVVDNWLSLIKGVMALQQTASMAIIIRCEGGPGGFEDPLKVVTISSENINTDFFRQFEREVLYLINNK